MKDFVDLLGRIFLSVIFLWDAVDYLWFYKSNRLAMVNYGITWYTDFWLLGAIVFLVVGGLMVLFGYRVSIGATLLLLYWLPANFIINDFWAHDFPERREISLLFWRNIAIGGGLMMLLAHGSGRYAIRRLFATTKVPKSW
jgi:putative oxidoreductase